MTSDVGFEEIVAQIGLAVEGVGVVVIVLGGIVATIFFFRRITNGPGSSDAYKTYRRDLGRALLLGLEFLVAGDIIRTVATDPTFESLGVLAGVVLIRTFLSFALELEIDGRWPWQRNPTPNDADGSAPDAI